jgi:hypothetical protein
MSLLKECPTDMQNLLAEFVGHPYVVGSEPRSFFFDNNSVSEHNYSWCETLDYEMELFDYEWQHEALYYKVIDVEGNTINVQGCKITWNDDDDEGTLVPTGPVLQRQVHETIEEDGSCSYWVVLRDAVNSGGGGPQMDDQLRFCPIELLVFEDDRCSVDRMNQVYFQS